MIASLVDVANGMELFSFLTLKLPSLSGPVGNFISLFDILNHFGPFPLIPCVSLFLGVFVSEKKLVIIFFS